MAGSPILAWLPPHADFRTALRALIRSAEPPERRLEEVAVLAQHRMDFIEVQQLDRLLAELNQPGDLNRGAGTAFLPVRLAMLASATLEHLAPAIRVAGLRRKLLVHIYTSGYGQYRQALLDPASSLREFRPTAILFSLTAHEAIAGIPVTATRAIARPRIDAFVEELRGLWRTARSQFGASVTQQTFVDTSEPLFGSFEPLVAAAPATLIAYLNTRVAEAAAEEAVQLLDIAGVMGRDGRDAWFHTGRWLQAKQEITAQAAPMYGELMARVLGAQLGRSRKCLVLDLDNTLWGGVIGDDGLAGLVLGDGSPTGEAHLALQRYARQLKERGIILAVCSKNDEKIARAALDEHPEMLLRCADFAIIMANWDDKAENLRAIARRLNIGLDSLVFVDDNPVERARIRGALPAVAVPELPDDVAAYTHCLAAAGYFEAIGFTAEDRERADQYAANAARDSLRDSATSMEEFLRSLDMTVTFGPFTPVDLPRIVQLINKTNQFNLTGRKSSDAEAASWASAPDGITLQLRLLDRFGDNGLVSALALRPAANMPDALELDTWVMSCRVFGRELEYEAMNIAVESARERGARFILADYVPTPRNVVVRTACEKLGFKRVEDDSAAAGVIRWQLAIADYVPRPTKILRRSN